MTSLKSYVTGLQVDVQDCNNWSDFSWCGQKLFVSEMSKKLHAGTMPCEDMREDDSKLTRDL